MLDLNKVTSFKFSDGKEMTDIYIRNLKNRISVYKSTPENYSQYREHQLRASELERILDIKYDDSISISIGGVERILNGLESRNLWKKLQK